MQIGDEVNRVIEQQRHHGKIGSSLEAAITIAATGSDYTLMQQLGEELRFVFITSAVRVIENSNTRLEVTLVPADAEKCARCWHRRNDVNSDPNYPGICQRCVDNIAGVGELRRFA